MPSSANFGTICAGLESANLALLQTSRTLARSSLLSLFAGALRFAKGLLSLELGPCSVQRWYVRSLIPMILQAGSSLAPLFRASSISLIAFLRSSALISLPRGPSRLSPPFFLELKAPPLQLKPFLYIEAHSLVLCFLPFVHLMLALTLWPVF